MPYGTLPLAPRVSHGDEFLSRSVVIRAFTRGRASPQSSYRLHNAASSQFSHQAGTMTCIFADVVGRRGRVGMGLGGVG